MTPFSAGPLGAVSDPCAVQNGRGAAERRRRVCWRNVEGQGWRYGRGPVELIAESSWILEPDSAWRTDWMDSTCSGEAPQGKTLARQIPGIMRSFSRPSLGNECRKKDERDF